MPTKLIDLREFDAVAVWASVELVSGVTAADLARPTPCAEWDLGALLAHMTVQHRGFAAAAAGHGADRAVWRPVPLGDDPVGAYAEAAEAVVAAFAPDDVLDRPFALPEFGTGQPFPGRLAVGFHLVDYVVHGWDVAAALGVGFSLPAEVLRATLPVARQVPDDERRLAPGAAFAPGRPIPAQAGALDEILRLLGRDPSLFGRGAGEFVTPPR
jgi:uncharacterized protein (TIGR03086 family)